MHPESAGAHIVTRVPVARESDRVRAVIRELGQKPFEALDAVYVVDSHQKLQGAVRLPKLHETAPETLLGGVTDRGYPRVRSHYDQEHVAELALKHRATSVAVVDDEERFIGAVCALSLLDILRHEHVEDLQRLTGVQREERRIRSALEAPPTRRARHRLPWLLVGLVGSMLAAVVVSRFERVLENNLSVAFFVPAIVYLADAIGTQTEAIVVRGLSLNQRSLGELMAGELRTGLLIGGTLAGLAFPIVAVGFGDVRLAVSVAAAILVAGGVATTIGLVLPWALQRAGSDPAFGSGPVATIIQDVLSLVIYFAIATALLR